MDIFFIDLFSKLQTWYNQIPELYSPSFCLLNEHMVGVHLWQCCECKQNRFIYKDGNAYLKDYYILMNPQHSLQQLLQGNKLF